MYQYNEAETMQMIREEGREQGREEGREEGMMELLANQVKVGDLSPEKAAGYAGMSLEQFLGYGK